MSPPAVTFAIKRIRLWIPLAFENNGGIVLRGEVRFCFARGGTRKMKGAKSSLKRFARRDSLKITNWTSGVTTSRRSAKKKKKRKTRFLLFFFFFCEWLRIRRGTHVFSFVAGSLPDIAVTMASGREIHGAFRWAGPYADVERWSEALFPEKEMKSLCVNGSVLLFFSFFSFSFFSRWRSISFDKQRDSSIRQVGDWLRSKWKLSSRLSPRTLTRFSRVFDS